MRDYTNRLYFGIDLGDTNGLVQTNINDRVYIRVIDEAEAGPNDRIFVIPTGHLHACDVQGGTADGLPCGLSRLDGGRHDDDARLPCDHTDPGRDH